MFEVERLIRLENELGESPRWDIEEQALYWLNIWNDFAVFRWDPKTGEVTRWTPGINVTGQARRRGGGAVFASHTGLYLWNQRTKTTELIMDPEAYNRPVRFNDGSADRQGRFWAGSTYADDQFRPFGSLYRLGKDCTVDKMAGGLACSNGLGWSPDSKTMYVTAQFAYELLAFDFDPVTGEIENRRVFASVPREDGLPDGLTVDAEGGVWSAHWGGWRLTRYDTQGKIERVVKLPVPNPTSCCFGGPGLTDLFVTSAWGWLSPEERATAPGSGDLFVIHTDIQGLPEPYFGD